MPRLAREKGEFQTYHVIMRGNERKKIFLSDKDRIRFIEILHKMKNKYNYKLEAYCLMDNHVHILINDNGNDISTIIKSINISYAVYFNHVHNRVGHLFQDRFKSQIVNDDRYLLAVSAYIHNNPVKAGMVDLPNAYKWSSMNSYLERDKAGSDLVDTDRILGIFSEKYKMAVEEYMNFVSKYEPDMEIIDVDEDRILWLREKTVYIDSFEAAKEMVEKDLKEKGKNIDSLNKEKALRYEIIVKLRKNTNLSLQEIGLIAGGLSKSMVCRILKKEKIQPQNRPWVYQPQNRPWVYSDREG